MLINIALLVIYQISGIVRGLGLLILLGIDFIRGGDIVGKMAVIWGMRYIVWTFKNYLISLPSYFMLLPTQGKKKSIGMRKRLIPLDITAVHGLTANSLSVIMIRTCYLPTRSL